MMPAGSGRYISGRESAVRPLFFADTLPVPPADPPAPDGQEANLDNPAAFHYTFYQP